MLGDRLKKLRKQKKITQEELGKKVNVTKVSISGYENGHRTPDTETLQKLADFFEVTTDYLLGRSDESNPHWNELTEKDEKDIAKRMEKIKEDLQNADGLNFSGEPISEEAVESLLEAMEYAVRQTQRINKKYIPKKHRKKSD
ncbi:helix-turn-helix domain-containing protein [Virgibacillus sp. Bac330]|uniref:helix-turn-helix domain-containing protein n=1 Tax=Virgibacillus sp. Bac330 TaxID=2419841 RepID=UPI000EF50778|nr:helix-turn-helix transcriptional regulator [Virgibacillus sp. Bac330]